MATTTGTTAAAAATATQAAAASSSTKNAATTSLSSAKGISKDDFLKLLITQLRFQDPLSPEDPKDFVAQLATFSSLEQQINLNQSLTDMGTQVKSFKDSVGMSQGVSLLGKEVKGAGNVLKVSSGAVNSVSFQLPKEAQSVKVAVTDSSGKTVRTLDLGKKAAGEHVLAWDGKNDQGQKVADGQYAYQVKASDAQGTGIEVNNYFTGKVQEVFRDTQGIWLKVNGRQMSLDQIVSVNETS